jgi:cyclohexanecarboxylate-CoA ligase
VSAPSTTTDFLRLEWSGLEARPPADLAAAEPGAEITVGELLEAARKMAAELRAAGVDRGDRVVVALTNSIRFVVAYLGARLAGGVVVNLPWQARRVLVAVAEEVGARTVILEDALVGDDPAHAALGSRRFERPVEGLAPAPTRPPESHAGRIAWLACTGGTTGRPKAAVHTEESWYHQTRSFGDAFRLTDRDPILVASPVGHAVGLLYGVRLALMLGSPMVLVPRWKAEAAAGLVARYGCTFTAAPTPFVLDLVRFAEGHGPELLRTLRYFPSGGAPVPLELLARARTALPGTQVSAYFGTSEAGAVTVCPPDAALEKRLGRDGRALPGMEVRVEDGELLVRGRQLAVGYWGLDSHERFRSDGWYATGDRATIDDDGFIRMRGRATDLILRGGENINPQEVEEVLVAHPAIREVAVVGFPDERLGERLAAVVIPEGSPPELEELRRCCDAAGLPVSCWPERLEVVEELPRTPIGKVLRDAVGERLTAPAS